MARQVYDGHCLGSAIHSWWTSLWASLWIRNCRADGCPSFTAEKTSRQGRQQTYGDHDLGTVHNNTVILYIHPSHGVNTGPGWHE